MSETTHFCEKATNSLSTTHLQPSLGLLTNVSVALSKYIITVLKKMDIERKSSMLYIMLDCLVINK